MLSLNLMKFYHRLKQYLQKVHARPLYNTTEYEAPQNKCIYAFYEVQALISTLAL